MAPQRTNRRFFPSKATIRNHIYKSVIKERFSKIDQEDLLKKVELWKEASPDDSFEFNFILMQVMPLRKKARDIQTTVEVARATAKMMNRS